MGVLPGVTLRICSSATWGPNLGWPFWGFQKLLLQNHTVRINSRDPAIHFLLVWGHKSISSHGFYRSNRSKRVAMRGYFAYVYANGAHVEVHEELICIRIRKRITFWGPWGANLHTYTQKEHILRPMRGYFAYVYDNGAHFLLGGNAFLHTCTQTKHILRSVFGIFPCFLWSMSNRK